MKKLLSFLLILTVSLGCFAQSPGKGFFDSGSSLNNGLISYWKLDAASGTANDSIGGNNLTANNNPLGATGKIGNGRQFVAASSQTLSILNNSSIQVGDIDFTLSAWIKADTLGATDDWFFKWNLGGTCSYILRIDNTGTVNFFVSPTGSTASASVSSSNTIAAGVWVFVCVWHDSVNDMLGIRVNSTENTTPHSAGVFAGTGTFILGRTCNGIIDEVSFHKRILTSAERTALYNSGNGLTYPFR